MNTIIFFSLVVLTVNIYYGVKRGFVRMILPLLANITAMLLLGATRGLWGNVLTKWVFADLSLVLVRLLVLVLLYIIVAALMKLLIVSLRILTKLPVLHLFNRLLGIAAGMVSGILCIWIFFAIVYICRDMQLGVWAIPQLQENPILFYMYEHNLITYIISDFF